MDGTQCREENNLYLQKLWLWRLQERWRHRVSNMEKKINETNENENKWKEISQMIHADKSLWCSVCHASIPTTSITMTQYAVYPLPRQIVSSKSFNHTITRVMVFQQHGYYYHPWRFDVTVRGRWYHFTLRKLCELDLGAMKLKYKSIQMRNMMCFILNFTQRN